MIHRPHHAFAVLAILFTGVGATAQAWRAEQIRDAGIEIEAPSRLERLPMQLGESSLYHRARFRPKDDADFVRAQYFWYCDVYSFPKNEQKPEDIELPEGFPPEAKEQLLRILAASGRKQLKSFKEWMDEKDKKQVTVEVSGKPKKGRSGKLDYAHWVWKDDCKFGPCGVVYCEAAVYDFPDKQVALVIEMPLESKTPGKPKSKWKSLIDHMIPSGKALDPDAGDDEADGKRDKYADTPERLQALADAKKNIEGLQGWDYFTQPNYIVIYSWNFERPDDRKKSLKEAKAYSSQLEKMRELYLTYYPLDATGTKAVMPDPTSIPDLGGPITGDAARPKPPDDDAEPAGEKLGVKHYSVFRLCATYEQFQKYGNSPSGVVGWFSPSSKELVVFLGGDQMMGSGATETVTYHEGWHQYANFYFSHPDTPGGDDLHRWFDEGHGDYFGSFRWSQNSWKYLGSQMRYDDCKQMVRKGDYVPFKDLVYWDRAKFYGGNAPYYYAQAFSMIDFLRRGEKERGWDPAYGEILDMYRKVMLVKGDSKLASDTAFRGFTDEKWQKLEDAWKAWVSGSNFKNGR